MNIKVKSYRAEIFQIFLPAMKCSFMAGVVLFVAIMVKSNFVGLGKIFLGTLMVASLVFTFTVLILLFATMCYKVTIYVDGVSSYDPWGTFNSDFMMFESMNNIKYRSIFGYKYYVIVSHDSTGVLWVPCKINDKADFLRKLRNCAGAENVFCLELMKSVT